MKKRAFILSVVAIALVVGALVAWNRERLPETSSLPSFAKDVRTAKRLFGSDYAGYLASLKRYGETAFRGHGIEQTEEVLRSQRIKNLQRHFENDLAFAVDGADSVVTDQIAINPKFSLHTDPFNLKALQFSADCDLTLDPSSDKVRQAMIRSGGFLKVVAEKPEFVEFCKNYPITLRGSLTYEGDNAFRLQMKFLSTELWGYKIEYSIRALVEPEEIRYVSWLPLTYRRAKGTIVTVEPVENDRWYTRSYNDVIRSLHREDLKYPYPTGIRLHYTNTENELETLPVETQGIQLVPPITQSALEKLARFNQLKSLSYIDPSQGGSPLLGLDKLVSLEFLSVEGELSVATVDAICRLPKLSDLHLEVANLSEEALAKIAAIPTLRSLYISSARVGDVGLESLAKSQSLEYLTMGERVGFTDRGVRTLGKMKSLRALHFYVPQKANLHPIYRMRNLEVLGLSRFKPTENDISSLASMSHLQGLMLDEISGVTPDQLLSFSKLTNLREFYFNQPNFPAAYMRQLRSLLPGKWLRN